MVVLLSDLSGGAGVRFDPFYGGMFGDSSRFLWASYGQVVEADGVGLVGLPASFRVEDGLLVGLLSGGLRGRVLRVLGLVVQWRTLSVEQLAGWLGVEVGRVWRCVLALWGFGLVELGFASNGLRLSRERRGVLVRCLRNSRAWGELRWLLSYGEWLSVCGGVAGVGGGHYDRHNVLMSELTLRVKENMGGEVGLVLGEPLATMDLLFGSGLGLPSRLDGRGVPVVDSRRADGVWVRGDGLRVVVEFTVRDSPSLSGKLRRWLNYLGSFPLERCGVVLLVVCACREVGEGERVRHHVSSLFEGFPEYAWRGRVFFVDWADWFPGPGRVDGGRFFDGRVLGADSGFGWGDGVCLWGDEGLGFGAGFDAGAVLANGRAVGW